MVGYVSFFPHTSSRYWIGWSIPRACHNAKQTWGPPIWTCTGDIYSHQWPTLETTSKPWRQVYLKQHSDWLQDRACRCSTGMSKFHHSSRDDHRGVLWCRCLCCKPMARHPLQPRWNIKWSGTHWSYRWEQEHVENTCWICGPKIYLHWHCPMTRWVLKWSNGEGQWPGVRVHHLRQTTRCSCHRPRNSHRHFLCRKSREAHLWRSRPGKLWSSCHIGLGVLYRPPWLSDSEADYYSGHNAGSLISRIKDKALRLVALQGSRSCGQVQAE